ncbi:MAG: beta-glucosidase [Phycisphaerae bacterium]|nr:MAG: beta-glucosidase [Phycisphaerae bacterium]
MSKHEFIIVRFFLSVVVTFSVTAGSIADEVAGSSPKNSVIDHRVDQLLKQMTIEEKLGQFTQMWGGIKQDTNPEQAERQRTDLNGQVKSGMIGSFLGIRTAARANELQRIAVEESRLGIPLILANDVIHGFRTIFPIPLAEAASFDPDAVRRSARVSAIEAASAGTHWTFAPMVDIGRDPRWGRVAEGAGEDPYLGMVMAKARVEGFQGNDLAAKDTILACAKHFAAYGGAEGGRDYNAVDVSISTLHNVYLPPFRAAVDSGVGSFMSAFNSLNGVPCTANHMIFQDILRDRWSYDGFVVSDWSSTTEMVAHGFARDDADAARQALLAGIDMDMSSFSFRSHLGKALEDGLIQMEDIDRGLARLLRAKFRLALFDRPYVDPNEEARLILCNEHRAAARDVARRSIVLLRNENSTLPITKNSKSIAVIGPLVSAKKDAMGTWAVFGNADDVVSVEEAMRARAGDSLSVKFARGCGVLEDDRTGFEEAKKLAAQSDYVVLVLGESEDLSGEAHCRTSLGLPGIQLDLAKEIIALKKPTAVVLMAGRPQSVPWLAENADAMIMAWHLGVESGNAITDVLFGAYNPGGKMPMTTPRNVGQVPIYYAHENTGRPPTSERYTSKYIDVPWTPLYSFGYGKSYTTFSFTNLALNKKQFKPDETLELQIDLTNTGKVAGDEVVQVYTRDMVASLTRPVRELKRFRRIHLAPGATTTAKFQIPVHELGFYGNNGVYKIEPGSFKVWVGSDSSATLGDEFIVSTSNKKATTATD